MITVRGRGEGPKNERGDRRGEIGRKMELSGGGGGVVNCRKQKCLARAVTFLLEMVPNRGFNNDLSSYFAKIFLFLSAFESMPVMSIAIYIFWICRTYSSNFIYSPSHIYIYISLYLY